MVSAHQEEPVDHVAKEVGLLGLGELPDSHVGQQLALQDFARILDAALPRHSRHAAALAYVIQRHLPVDISSSLVNKGPYLGFWVMDSPPTLQLPRACMQRPTENC